MLGITAGFPLSGKSTLCCGLMNKNIVVVNPDTIRLALHGKQFEPLAEPFVWATAQIMVRTLLKQGHDVIVDATNTTIERRKMWVNMAKEFGLKLEIDWVTTSSEICFKRNEELKRLDNSIIERMVSQFEEPTDKEGIIIKY